MTRITSTACILFLLSTSAVYAAKAPKSVLTDSRVKQLSYDPNQVFEITANNLYQTVIEFGENEHIDAVAMGNTTGLQTQTIGNKLFIKPAEENLVTNLTVLTTEGKTKRMYLFNVHGAPENAPSKSMTFAIKFVYPGEHNAIAKGTPVTPEVIAEDPSKFNFDYGISGDQATIALKKVFDNGEFTYFLFEPKAEIPSFYVVLSDGSEAIANTRREGQYMVVERTAGQFTLRNGTAHLCVRNNTVIHKVQKTVYPHSGVVK